MRDIKFTSEQRQMLKAEILAELNLQPNKRPSKGVNMLIKSELIQLAIDLGIDIHKFGSAMATKTVQPVKPTVVTAPVVEFFETT